MSEKDFGQLAVDMSETWDALGPRERSVLLLLAKRLLMGQKQYGLLKLEDPREWTKEATEEALDLSVYLTLQLLKGVA